jgi:hypothetical protein
VQYRAPTPLTAMHRAQAAPPPPVSSLLTPRPCSRPPPSLRCSQRSLLPVFPGHACVVSRRQTACRCAELACLCKAREGAGGGSRPATPSQENAGSPFQRNKGNFRPMPCVPHPFVRSVSPHPTCTHEPILLGCRVLPLPALCGAARLSLRGTFNSPCFRLLPSLSPNTQGWRHTSGLSYRALFALPPLCHVPSLLL